MFSARIIRIPGDVGLSSSGRRINWKLRLRGDRQFELSGSPAVTPAEPPLALPQPYEDARVAMLALGEEHSGSESARVCTGAWTRHE
jgi:hypothetical protein